MINLIPETIRTNNRYSARNVVLLRYTAVSLLTMLAIVAITGLTILSMNRTQTELQRQSQLESKRIESFKSLQAQGVQLSDQITTINSLLARQVTFSSLLPQIAQIMPPGAVLKEMNLSTSDILPASGVKPVTGVSSAAGQQKPFIILAAVKDRTVAATLLENVRASKNLFIDADIVSISQANVGSTDANSTPSISSRYPYQVTINAYLKKINPQSIPASPISQKGTAQ
jgi:hypothetical protein